MEIRLMAHTHSSFKTAHKKVESAESELSLKFKKDLDKIREEVKKGRYVSYKTLDDMDKDI